MPAERSSVAKTPESSLGSSGVRLVIPKGDFGSIVHAEGVTIPVSGNKPAQELGHEYEQGIRTTFGSGNPEGTFVARIKRFVDDVFDDHTLEAKHVDVYVRSIYNPRTLKEWQHAAVDRAIAQARKITDAHEGGAIYFTNDEAFAADYTLLFKQNGISKFRFVIVPSVKIGEKKQ